MSIEELKQMCERFPGVTQDLKWGHHVCFNVGGKMFLMTTPDEVPQNASFKASDDDFETLSARRGFVASPYLARYNWVKLDDINRLTKKEWEKYIRLSYELVYERLPAKLKKEIDPGSAKPVKAGRKPR